MSNNVEKIRLLRNLTQTELARRIGTVPSTISRLEAGTRKLNQEYLHSLSKALGCEPADLLGSPVPEISEARLVPIVGSCDSTSWRVSPIDHGIRRDLPVLPVLPSVRLRALDHAAYLVADQHTDLCKSGSHVIITPMGLGRSIPVTGDYLVIRRKEGKMEQHLVVQAVVDAGGLSFTIDGERVISDGDNWPVGSVVAVYCEV